MPENYYTEGDLSNDNKFESDVPVNEGQVNKILVSLGEDPDGNNFVNKNIEISEEYEKDIKSKIENGEIKQEALQNILAQISPWNPKIEGDKIYGLSGKISMDNDLKNLFNYSMNKETINYSKLWKLGLNSKNHNGYIIPRYNTKEGKTNLLGYRGDGRIEKGIVTGYYKERLDMLFYDKDGKSTTRNVSLDGIIKLNYPYDHYHSEEIIKALQSNDEVKLRVITPKLEKDWRVTNYQDGKVSVRKIVKNASGKNEALSEQIDIEEFQALNNISVEEIQKNLNKMQNINYSVKRDQIIGYIEGFDPNTNTATVILNENNQSKYWTIDKLNNVKYHNNVTQEQMKFFYKTYPEPISFVNTMETYIQNANSEEEQEKRRQATETFIDQVFGKQGEYYRQMRILFNKNYK